MQTNPRTALPSSRATCSRLPVRVPGVRAAEAARTQRLAALLAAAFALAACESPDPEAEMDDFRDAALSDVQDSDTATGCGDVRPTPSGEYFCALSATLARDKPLYVVMTFTLDGDTLTIDAQPIVRDLDEDGTTPMANARQPVGDPLPQVVTTYGDNGEFTVDWPGITILGPANPLTFRDLGGDLVLNGAFVTDDVAFGRMGGLVTNPTEVPLDGSNFACQRSDDPASVDPVYYDERILELTPCAEGSGEGSGAGEGSAS